MNKVPLKKLDRTSRAKHFKKKKTLRFIALTKLVVLAFENLNDHENLMKNDIIPPNYGDLIKPKIILGARLTPSIIGLSVGEGIPAMV